jgi:hypothetical protein
MGLLLRGCLSALVIVALSPSTLKTAFAQDVITSTGRAIPEDNLAYPVLLSMQTIIGKSLASGFFLNATHAMYLVTANHFFTELANILRDTNTKQYRPMQMFRLPRTREIQQTTTTTLFF